MKNKGVAVTTRSSPTPVDAIAKLVLTYARKVLVSVRRDIGLENIVNSAYRSDARWSLATLPEFSNVRLGFNLKKVRIRLLWDCPLASNGSCSDSAGHVEVSDIILLAYSGTSAAPSLPIVSSFGSMHGSPTGKLGGGENVIVNGKEVLPIVRVSMPQSFDRGSLEGQGPDKDIIYWDIESYKLSFKETLKGHCHRHGNSFPHYSTQFVIRTSLTRPAIALYVLGGTNVHMVWLRLLAGRMMSL